MKFANLYWFDDCVKDAGIIVNIGDILQFLAIDYIYELMGIPKDSIIRLSTDELKTYRGEEVVLPLNWGILQPEYMVGNRISISDRIVPVFLAMTLGGQYHDAYINAENIAYLKRYEPIGCRDQFTMEFLNGHGVNAYLNGCMTSILPKRDNYGNPNKAFLIDIPESLRSYLPQSILANAEVIQHQQNYNKYTDKFDIIENIKRQYQRYSREAGLIVTSRLHAASPCMAMGIPVIFTKRILDSRFGWIDKFLPLYEIDKFDSINWQPEAIEYEALKQDIINQAIQRIEAAYTGNSHQIIPHSFWHMDNRKRYRNFYDVMNKEYENAKAFLKKRYHKLDKFTYGLWGIKENAINFYHYMCGNYPNARLNLMVDRFRKIELAGITATSPEQIDVNETDTIFVFAMAAVQEATTILSEQNFKISNCCIVCDNFMTSI